MFKNLLIALAISTTFVPVQLLANQSTYIAGKSTMSESRKKQIFTELVRLQDSGYGKEKSEAIIKERYNLTSSELLDILLEGHNKDWLSDI